MKKYLMLFSITLLVICFSSCGARKVKDEDAAYDIIDAWKEEHWPLSEKDSSFVMDTEGGIETQTIDGDIYYSSILKVVYTNKNHLQDLQLGRDSAYENPVAEGTLHVRERDGSIYVNFTGEMEPIDEWYASFENWVVSVAPLGYDRFIIAPLLYDFVNITDYSGLYGDGWTYELLWDNMDIAKGYEIECTELSPEDDEPYKEIYDQAGNVFTVSASDPVEVTARVRAYVEEDGERIYGAWSETRSIIFGSDDPVLCLNVTWQDLMRYPESYIDEEVQLPKVTVLQDAGNGLYRVWDNDLKIYVINTSNASGAKILEGDSLLVQGNYAGIETFNMTDGSTEDYPYVMVDYYEILNLN